ncbi:outer membrane protein transport protein [Shewanella eurypsychrophilus]|uniref:Outer membrane protein transport protein n=1 Tax=Shewanella eurypsychrophilus TaxID=2593656 RepID=A0ABX6VCD6_9GAMM|nr:MULTISPECIES: outer membrane protein transport protein [Shewanella]QFU25129.1 aromatic hydrocarbon degradation protein [Shewanella sp. YLB-09]QFU25150.1 aromatic hydrocarbon degradation protein [Shewanella sp. YLB-09]QPG60301.1 outer membrane protein transport protein [Shewanella eurypsychrophilus]
MNKRVIALAVATALMGSVTQAQAAGFQLAEYSATGQGRAFAGEAAMADNASTQARNPAMLTYLEGTHFSAGGIYVMPNVDVTGDVSIASALLGPDPLVMNGDALDVAGNALVPNFYFSSQLNENWTWGLAVNSNYGLATEVPTTHSAAIFGNETSVTTVEFNPNIAYRFNDAFSVGAGIRVVYGEGSIGATAPGWIDSLKAHPALPEEIAAALPAGGTSLKSMEGDDIAMGWKVGASWQINPVHRLGLAYHSGVELELDGSASGLLYTGGQDVDIEGNLPLELPAFAELASYHQLSDKFAMHASVNWTQWSVFDELVAYFPGDVKPVGGLESDLVKEENFKDNWRFALGSTYQLNNEWLLRTGVAYDMTAVDDEYRTMTIPDSDRLWFSVGAGYQASENLTFDFAVTYIKAYGDAPINESMNLMDLAQVSFDGEASGDVWLVGMQLSYKM